MADTWRDLDQSLETASGAQATLNCSLGIPTHDANSPWSGLVGRELPHKLCCYTSCWCAAPWRRPDLRLWGCLPGRLDKITPRK